MALNKQQELFCQEFIACKYKASEAYEKVYSPAKREGIYCGATRLMKNPEVKARIKELEKEIFEANNITAEHIANELSEMAFDKNTPQNIKLKALDLLQKQAGLQTQKVQAEVSKNIEINITGG